MSSTNTHNNPKNIFTINNNINTTTNNCNKYSKTPLNYTPVIMYITPNSVINNIYTEVCIYGYNFFNSGSTYVTLTSNNSNNSNNSNSSNNSSNSNNINIPISYYSSKLITFIVPSNLEIITYTLNVVNNISYAPINVSSIPPSQLSISNSVEFIVSNS
jgi:hypothetical protein